jgi:invasion protein IalB
MFRTNILGRRFSAAVAAFAGALVASTAAMAVEPDSSSVAFQDWTVNCAKAPAQPATAASPAKPAGAPAAAAKPAEAGAPAAKDASVCEIVQSFVDKNSQRLIARIAIGRTPANPELKLVLQTPVGVWLADGAVIAASEKAQAKAVFVRCSPTACFAEADAKKEFLDAAKTAEKMTLTFPDGARTPVALTVSTRGFAAALAGLDKK